MDPASDVSSALPGAPRPVLRDPALEATFRDQGWATTRLITREQVAELGGLVRDVQGRHDIADVHIATPFRLSAFCNDGAYKERLFQAVWAFLEPHVSALLDDFEPLVVNVFDKPGTGDDSVAIHQNPSFVDPPLKSVSLWIPLVDVTRENGTVGVLRGSQDAFDALRASNMPDIFAPCAAALTERYFEPIVIGAGECAALDDGLVHWSYPNRTRESRTAVQLIMVPRGVPHVYHYYDTSAAEPRLRLFEVGPDFFFRFNCKAEPEGLRLVRTVPYVYRDFSEAEVVARVAPRNRHVRSLAGAAL